MSGSDDFSKQQETPRGLHGHVVDRVGRLIAHGEVAVNSQLMPDQIGQRFGVSRTVVREALRVLETKGMVRARPRLGTRVQPVEKWDLLDRDVILWRTSGPGRDEQLRDLIGLRLAIEPVAARAACDHASSQQLDEMDKWCAGMEEAVRSNDQVAFTDADIQFHSCLLLASGNQIFAQLAEAVEAVLTARAALNLMPDHVEHAAVATHRDIVYAIRRGSARIAESASRELLEIARSEIFNSQPPDQTSTM